MIESQQLEVPRATGRPARPACLVPGCPCKDARIVSYRRAAYFAARATANGETANRIVEQDPTWSLAGLTRSI